MNLELQLPQARSAQFEGISFRADGWAIRQNEALTARIRQIQTKVAELAATPDASPIPEDVVVSLIYRHGKVSAAYWDAMSRVMSPMITGPARFPVERNRKRADTADKRLGEIEPDLQRALKALERLAFPHGMPGDAVRGSDPDALSKLKAELVELEARIVRENAANKAIRKGDWAGVEAAVGPELAAKEKAFKERWGYCGFHVANRRANAARIRDRIAALEARQERGRVEGENQFFKVIEDPDLDRIQLIFEGKPDEAVRRVLKARGFRWAPSHGAWQRHLNNNGRWAAKYVQSDLEKAVAA